MNQNEKEYFLGLDMGTSSVGWAVTDPDYNLLRARGRDLWGIREFDEALTAVDRRTHRVARRRRQREIVRIALLKDYFYDAIAKQDPNFYVRLENSKYHLEDKDEAVRTKNGIFNDREFKDVDYFKQYPTIFHLRKELIKSKDTHDVRLVYLALINMFKHRGHFLNATIGIDNEIGSLQVSYDAFCELLTEILLIDFPSCDGEKLEEILSCRDYSRTRKAEEIAKLLNIDLKEKQKMGYIKCICGLKVDVKLLFGDKIEFEDDKKLEICFSDVSYEEKVPDLLLAIGEDNFNLINYMKEIYDTGSLAGIMKGYKYLSEARVAEYDKHKQDLVIIKKLFKKYCTEKEYDSFFRKGEPGTYSAYVNSTNSDGKFRRDVKGRSREDLYTILKKYLKKMDSEDTNVQYVITEIDKETFLPKQITVSNGVIPNQVHLKEMKQILKNAENYLYFLKKKDELGLSVSDKIMRLFSFQIPYFIGPVTEKSKANGGNGWVVRKEEGQVLPWNIDSKIDMKKTSEEFISRMVRRCTYLSEEMVLPKASLLYEKFCVLNEINNIRIHGEKLSVQMKQDLYSELFEKGKKVSRKQVNKYLINRGVIVAGEESQITGIDISINNSLSSYGKFHSIFGNRMLEDSYKDMAEQIIRWCTLYGDSKRFLREQLEEKYLDKLNEDQIKRILGFKFKDWGNMSKSFLELCGCSKETGEKLPLIRMMWDTNDNLMELLASDKYTYKEELEVLQRNAFVSFNEIKPGDLDEMYFSAPVKRMVWQTLSIIKELQYIMGCAPKRLFVEMTRKEDKEKQRKDSRKQLFLNLYKNIKEDGKNWKNIIETAEANGSIRSKKMYLYLTQMGRCMYTGEPIDLDKLFNDNLYDIDHIYPRHFVKDDNISNNLVLVKKETNAHKSDKYPLEDGIHYLQSARWKELCNLKLITEEKYRRLTGKNPFTDEQKAGFIARQLVETSQGTKGVTTILEGVLPDTKIVYAKASNVSEFRQKRDMLKSRIVNDFHHAQDAYLNIVVGNAYYVKFTQTPINFIQKEYNRDAEKNRYNLSRMFDWDIRRENETAWIAQHGKEEAGTIVTVKKVMSRNTPLLTRLSFEGHGGIADQTLYSSKKAQGSGYYSLKSSDSKMCDVTKYGGFGKAGVAYFFLVEHGKEGKRIRTLEAVPIILKNQLSQKQQLQEYCERELNLEKPRIKVNMIKMQSLIKRDGYYLYISGKTLERICVRNAVELVIDRKWINYIKEIENSVEKSTISKKINKESNITLFQLLVEKHRDGIFSQRPNPLKEKLELFESSFCKLEVPEQNKVIIQMLKLSNIGVTVADLRLIGGSMSTGVMLISKNISASKEFLLVNQSVTGIYEKRIDLLTI